VNILEFFEKESDAPKAWIMFMAILSGIANGLLLAIINVAAEMASNQHSEARFFFLYLIAFALFVYTLRYALSQATIAVEDVIRKVRVRVVNKIRSSELHFIESTGRSEIYTRLTQDSNLISQSALILITAGQAFIVLVFSLFYVALLSPLSFVLTLMTFSLGLLLYFSIEKKLTDELERANQKEAEFFDSLDHVLDGFKEIKINQRKNEDLFNYVETISNDTEALKVSSGIRMITAMMFSQMAFYLLLAVLIFIVPVFSASHTDIIFKITATILFIEGPLGMLVGALPMLARTNVAVTNISNLEAEIDAASTMATDQQPAEPSDFKEIKLEEVIFHYTDKQGKPSFSVGPFNITIKQGERLFIVGGNGSGKSTLLKVLVGLYYPTVGCLYLDGEEIDHTNYQSYRELFSTIFTDFHLFDRFYGLPAIDEQRVKSLLRLMELEKKTKYIDGKFTNTSLSTGQKKRLAFIGAVLEDKPVYIFDELAADQDPHFRKYFYEVILKDLQKQGKTIIAVTHDDKYFNTADRVLKMEYGKLVDYEHE
jgi:putative pyoverdin transport system ATP-binding/permease protein